MIKCAEITPNGHYPRQKCCTPIPLQILHNSLFTFHASRSLFVPKKLFRCQKLSTNMQKIQYLEEFSTLKSTSKIVQITLYACARSRFSFDHFWQSTFIGKLGRGVRLNGSRLSKERSLMPEFEQI